MWSNRENYLLVLMTMTNGTNATIMTNDTHCSEFMLCDGYGWSTTTISIDNTLVL